ncbi:MAG: hypothetical protein QHH24_07930, partial [Candidatus Bathyarchaeota archaeon]|nr:hypothetical protein [Candidatus Bathyarchaeota archaeon]
LEILDGHQRFRACMELGIEPDFEVRKFEDKLLEKKFVIEANLRRRHLTKFQLVELGVPLLEIEKELAKKRQAAGGKLGRNIQLGLAPDDAKPVPKGKATEAVAKKAGVSTRTFERGKKILEMASEEDKQRLREGKASIYRLYREVIAKERGFDAEAESKSAFSVAETATPDPRLEQSRAELAALLQKLVEKEVFCLSCGNAMFECSKCHKTLRDMLKQKIQDKNFQNM